LGDFIFPVLIAIVVGGFSWGRWYGPLLTVTPLASPRRVRTPLYLVPIFCFTVVFLVLLFLASPDVRNDTSYIIAYLCLSIGWLGGATLVFPLLGVSARDDVIERNNHSALWTLAGALISVTLCFAGANIGSGPGPEVVFFCAILATCSLFFQWFILEAISAPSDAITVERDENAGIRLAGFLVGTGLLLGGAVAGDWASAHQTLLDFCFRAWPSIVLLAIAAILERVYRRRTEPAGQCDRGTFGIASLYILSSAVWVVARGWQ